MAPNSAATVLHPDDDVPTGAVIEGFQAILPVSDDVCRQQIAANIARGLPEAIRVRQRLAIIANGPSARDVDLSELTCPTLAVNGSISLFEAQGIYPTYWACCDPQARVADLLPPYPPEDTIYFVASKCHPSVFDKLRYRSVRIWHLTDYPVAGKLNIATCSSITMSAAWLMYRRGYTDFEFYGWDGCFMDGQHHASDASSWGEPPLYINYGGKVVGEQVIGGRNFPTTRSWAAEAHNAQQFFSLAKYFDIGVKIHGDGMFKAAQEFMFNQE